MYGKFFDYWWTNFEPTASLLLFFFALCTSLDFLFYLVVARVKLQILEKKPQVHLIIIREWPMTITHERVVQLIKLRFTWLLNFVTVSGDTWRPFDNISSLVHRGIFQRVQWFLSRDLFASQIWVTTGWFEWPQDGLNCDPLTYNAVT